MRRVILLALAITMLAACGAGGKGTGEAGREGAPGPAVVESAPPQAAPEAPIDGLNDMYARAEKDMNRLGGAIEAYWQSEGHFPAVETMRGLAALPGFAPDYIKAVPCDDPWGNEYLYEYSPFGFKIGCGGSDGVFDGFDQAGEVDVAPGVDIVYANMGFALHPQVKYRQP